MGIFKVAGDSFRRRQFINDLNRRFKTGFVVNQDPYLVNFKTAITTEGLYLRGVVQNDYSLRDQDANQMGKAVLSNEMVKRELFALGFVGLQIVGKTQSVGLKWNLGDVDASLRNDHPYLSIFGSAGESLGQMMDERKYFKELEEWQRQQDAKALREAQVQLRKEEAERAKKRREEEAKQQSTKKEEPKLGKHEKKCFSCSKRIFKISVKCPYCGTLQTRD